MNATERVAPVFSEFSDAAGRPWTRFGFLAEPLDVLFFRDGRPFGTGATSHGRGGLPSPQVMAGTLRTMLLAGAVGFDELTQQQRERKKNGVDRQTLTNLWLKEATDQAERRQLGWMLQAHCRGPWLASLQEEGGAEIEDVFVPVPAELVQLGKEPDSEIARLKLLPDKVELPGWMPPSNEAELRPLWYCDGSQEVHPCEGFLGLKTLQTYLEGGCPSRTNIKQKEDLYEFEHRTGVGIEPDRLAAEDKILYSTSLLRLKKRHVFYAEMDVPLGQTQLQPLLPPAFFTDHVQRLGGEARLARIRTVKPIQWPEVAADRLAERSLQVLLTPAPFPQAPHWRPPTPAGWRLVGAAVPAHQSISGWDLALGAPKPARHFAPTGSVYYYEREPGRAGPDAPLCAQEDFQLGYGVALKGAWKHHE